ncbi:MAG: transcriptional antiterminator, Rof [Parasulfuritortus sp.]|jgi:Rho-binding antiterminator|nr:transcriptional antiterminator, Rof [Parasulfuritortus sp.]
MSDYVPIACVAHERLEFAVLKRRRLHLVCLVAGDRVEIEVMPLDVYTREGAEWMRARNDDGQEMTLRLDTILDFREIQVT